ncbi:MAG: hypothetical protein A6F71_00230 [Cycloclasticus sp. symbiont of Poecilosclerida sp. M]|nr:MAG: hypothetical protein A6F71_00230 [Cycloclasticus sp. symbiont of Poecilosclerida sp. M]
MSWEILVPCSFLLSWVLVYFLQRHAKRFGLISSVNERSSHIQPTPHGGGVGFVISGSLIGFLFAMGGSSFLWIIVTLALLIATIGLFDDIYSSPALLRLLIQIGVSFSLILSLTNLPITGLVEGALYFKWLFIMALVIAAVWWINLFNFMDGIDGIAAMQAVFMLLSGLGLSYYVELASIDTQESIWLLCVVGATVGFAVHNWPPARIFMGDVGSTWLAFVIFSFALYSVEMGWLSYTVWLILSALFITDATVTLLRRMALKMKWYKAHRSRMYQRLARRWGKHSSVVIAYLAINVIWLLPLASISTINSEWAQVCLLAAYVPLVSFAVVLGAGRQEMGVQ